jgi:hypothetical protein
MKIAETTAQKITVIDAIDRIVKAAGQPLTRGDVTELVRAALSTTPYLSVTEILDPRAEGLVRVIVPQAQAVVAAVRATSADTLEYL